MRTADLGKTCGSTEGRDYGMRDRETGTGAGNVYAQVTETLSHLLGHTISGRPEVEIS